MPMVRATEWSREGILGTRVHVVIPIGIGGFPPIHPPFAPSGI